MPLLYTENDPPVIRMLDVDLNMKFMVYVSVTGQMEVCRSVDVAVP